MSGFKGMRKMSHLTGKHGSGRLRPAGAVAATGAALGSVALPLAVAFTVAAMALLAFAPPARGQSKTGTAIGEFTLIEPSARIAAMGNAGVALNDGLQCVYYNPAALGRMQGIGVQFTHSEWIADIGYEYVAASIPLRYWGCFFGSVTALNSGEIDVRTVDAPLGTGERYDVSDVALALGFGHAFSDRFSAGLQLNYLSETIWHSSLHAWTLNVGTLYRLTEDGLQLGASISNFGTDGQFSGRDLAIQYDEDPDEHGDNGALPGYQSTDEFPVPVLFRLGLAWPRSLGRDAGTIVAVADAAHSSSNTESLSGGLEWRWRGLFAVRGGYQDLGQEDAEGGLTLGAGLRGALGAQTFEFDYAWADQGRLEETHRFTFVVNF